eukprot:TRINITY_DN9292_c0_g1_i1.p1 TRINITY_DN9292_c0_g1~~TRINITY_DN9292_c0_g1_i1.p1  ORF type:complete len:2104 (+),score=484.85 TRINITY_DN9292_c0_g1_i1:610-6921(+)
MRMVFYWYLFRAVTYLLDKGTRFPLLPSLGLITTRFMQLANSGGKKFEGKFHAMATYERALSLSEIQQNFASGNRICIDPVCIDLTALSMTIHSVEGTTSSFQLQGAASSVGGNDTMQFLVVELPLLGALVLNTTSGLASYTPTGSFAGTDSFTFITISKGFQSPVAVVNIVVRALLHVFAADQVVTTDQDTLVQFPLLGWTNNATGNASLSFSIVSSATNGALVLNATTGMITYTPLNHFAGIDTFTFSASSLGVSSPIRTVTVTVTSLIDLFVSPLTVETYENTPVTFKLPSWSNSAPANLSMVFSLSQIPLQGAFQLNSSDGTVTYTPNSFVFGADSMTFRTNFGLVQSALGLIDIVVHKVNMFAQPTSLIGHENTPLSFGASGWSDALVANNSLVIVFDTLSPNALLNFNSSTGLYDLVPTDFFVGTISLTYLSQYLGINSSLATVLIDILPVNMFALPATLQLTAGTNATLRLTGWSDSAVGNQSLSFSLNGSASHGNVSIDALTGVVTYVPFDGFFGVDSFTFSSIYNRISSAASTVTVLVADVLRMFALPVAVEVTQDTDVTFTLNGFSNYLSGNQSLVFVLDTAPVSGSLLCNSSTGECKYTPGSGFIGADAALYHTESQGVSSLTAPITIVVLPQVQITVQSLTVQVLEDTAALVKLVAWTNTLLGNNSMLFEIVQMPSNASVSGFNASLGELLFAPATDFNGETTLQFRVNVLGLLSSTATVTFQVLPVNDAPLIFLAIADPVLTVYIPNGDSAGRSLNSLVSAVPGPLNELTQAVTLGVSVTSGTSVFSSLPQLFANGTLSFGVDPAAALPANVTLRISAQDDGGLLGVNLATVDVTLLLRRSSGLLMINGFGDGGSLQLSPGGSQLLSISLVKAPLEELHLPLASSTGNLVISPSVITFTPLNWYLPALVTVQSLLGSVSDLASLTIGNLTRDSELFASVWTLVTDASSQLQAVSSQNTLLESQASALVAVGVTAVPVVPVTVLMTVSDATVMTVSPAVVAVTAENWLSPRLVTVTSRRDGIVNAGRTVTITASVTAGSLLGLSVSTTVFVANVDSASVALAYPAQLTELSSGTMIVSLGAIPLSTVRVSLSSSDTLRGIVRPPVVDIQPWQWQTGVAVTIFGVLDLVSSFAHDVTLTATCSSADPNFNAVSRAATVRFINVNVPRISGIAPALSTLAGNVSITVTGFNFEPLSQLYIGSNQVSFSFVSSNQIVFTAPATNISGYANVTVINTDPMAPAAVLSRTLYFTNDCPTVGSFGIGSNCQTCPVGGYCPGGNRIWPLGGYWNADEGSGFVYPCAPAERCSGGQDSDCNEGYAGDFCGACGEGWTRQADICVQCPSAGLTAVFIIIGVVFFSFLVFATFTMRDKPLTQVMLGLITLQLMRETGQMASSELPAWIQTFYALTSLLTLEFSFLQPGCGFGSSSFRTTFYGTLTIVLLLNLTVLVGLPLVAYIRKLLIAHTDAKAAQQRYQFYMHRTIRGVIVMLSFVHYSVTSIALQALFCINVHGTWILQQDRTIVCYQGEHIAMVAVGWLLFAVVTLAFPLFCLYVMLRHRAALHTVEVRRRYGYLYESFQEASLVSSIFQIFQFGLAFLMAASAALLDLFARAQLGVTSGSMLVFLAILLILRPNKETGEFVLNIVSCCASLAGAALNFLGSDEFSGDDMHHARLILSIIVIALGVASVLMYIVFTIVKAYRRYKRNKTLHTTFSTEGLGGLDLRTMQSVTRMNPSMKSVDSDSEDEGDRLTDMKMIKFPSRIATANHMDRLNHKLKSAFTPFNGSSAISSDGEESNPPSQLYSAPHSGSSSPVQPPSRYSTDSGLLLTSGNTTPPRYGLLNTSSAFSSRHNTALISADSTASISPVVSPSVSPARHRARYAVRSWNAGDAIAHVTDVDAARQGFPSIAAAPSRSRLSARSIELPMFDDAPHPHNAQHAQMKPNDLALATAVALALEKVQQQQQQQDLYDTPTAASEWTRSDTARPHAATAPGSRTTSPRALLHQPTASNLLRAPSPFESNRVGDARRSKTRPYASAGSNDAQLSIGAARNEPIRDASVLEEFGVPPVADDAVVKAPPRYSLADTRNPPSSVKTAW